MFIVYEICSYHHKTVPLPDHICPMCQAKSTLQMHIMQKYTSWFGPMAPHHKYGVLECTACDQTVPNKKWEDSLDAVYKKHKAEAKTPLKLWQNMIVIPLIFLLLYAYTQFGPRNPFGLRDYKQAAIETTAQLQHVKQGDVLYINFGADSANDVSSAFGIVKIDKIVGDKVFLKVYEQRWGDFQGQYDMKQADLDLQKFVDFEATVSLDQIHKNEHLYKLKGAEKDRYIGNIEGFIQ
jgi:hypothetical protein